MTLLDQPLLEVDGLSVCYRTPKGARRAVRGVDLLIAAGETVAVVGESGSGKSTLAHALIGLLPNGGYREAGSIRFAGTELTALSERELRSLRGSGIGFIPQDPSASLNPVRRVGHQIAGVLRLHERIDRRSAAARAVELLDQAGVETWLSLRRATRLGITVLADHHGSLARQLSGPPQHRFDNVDIAVSAYDAAIITGGLAHFETSLYREVEAGDHTLALLRIHAIAHANAASPLVFHRSTFHRLAGEPVGANQDFDAAATAASTGPSHASSQGSSTAESSYAVSSR